MEDYDKENEQQNMTLDDMLPDMGHGKPFLVYLFSTKKTVEVQYIPPNIDGFKMYKIHTNDKEWAKVILDWQYFDLKTSSHQNFYGTKKGSIWHVSLTPHAHFKIHQRTTSQIM